jgi:flagellar basal body-associated protein FliL
MSDGHPDLNETEARQGRRGRHVLMILVISLTLVIIAFAIIWLTHSDDLAGAGGQQSAPASAAAQFDAPEPAPIAGAEATPTTPPSTTEAAQPASPPSP